MSNQTMSNHTGPDANRVGPDDNFTSYPTEETPPPIPEPLTADTVMLEKDLAPQPAPEAQPEADAHPEADAQPEPPQEQPGTPTDPFDPTNHPIQPLYRLTNEWLACYDPETGDWDTDKLKLLKMPLNVKGANLACVILSYRASLKSIREAKADLTARAKSLENQRKHLEQYGLKGLEALELAEIGDDVHSIRWQKARPKVGAVDMSLLEAKYVKELREPDKTEILKDFKIDGVIPPGVEIILEPTLKVR